MILERMPTTLPSTAVAIIELLNHRLGIVPPTMAGRPASLPLTNECSVILSTVIAVVETVPDALLRVGTEQRTQFAAALEDLRHATGLLRNQDANFRRAYGTPMLEPMRWLDGMPHAPQNRYATEVLRDVLLQCPDEIVQPTTSVLSFIADAPFRESLRLDLSALNTALANGEYKAATVLGGSVVEALLLWGLAERTQTERQSFITSAVQMSALSRTPDADLNRWDLHVFIEVATAGHIITGETATIARLAKDFRNMIHPGRAERMKQRCDRSTALTVVAAVERIITDFTSAMP